MGQGAIDPTDDFRTLRRDNVYLLETIETSLTLNTCNLTVLPPTPSRAEMKEIISQKALEHEILTGDESCCTEGSLRSSNFKGNLRRNLYPRNPSGSR
jgi:hypothetical protein